MHFTLNFENCAIATSVMPARLSVHLSVYHITYMASTRKVKGREGKAEARKSRS